MWLTNISEEGEPMVEVTGDRFSIGRDPTCNLVLNDEKVSRRHARVEALPHGRALINDQGSSNGTFVNGARIASGVELEGGEDIRIGGTVFRCSPQQARSGNGGLARPAVGRSPTADSGGSRGQR